MPIDTGSQDDIANDRHAKLTRVAVLANVFVWVVLIFYILSAGARWFSLQSQLNAFAAQSGHLTFADQMRNDPAYALGVYLQVASIIVQGVVAALVLKGISLGLFMIVETDLNFRAVKEKEGAQ
jgi:hypothetical protein